MSRTLSTSALEQAKARGDAVSTLVETCLRAKLPMSYVAVMLGVSRMTVHSWMRGGEMRYGRDVRITTFVQIIEDDIQAGLLPKKSLKETKEYAEQFSGKAISNTKKQG